MGSTSSLVKISLQTHEGKQTDHDTTGEDDSDTTRGKENAEWNENKESAKHLT